MGAQSGTVLDRYLADIREYPLLTKEQELALARKVRAGDSEACDRLVVSNLGFVIKIAGEYRGCGLAFEDLLSEGNLGLLEAARRYDPGRGTKFITYAIWWIRKSILRALNWHGNLVRIPAYEMKKRRQMRETEKAMRQELGRLPSRDEIGARMAIPIDRVDALTATPSRTLSLDQPASEGHRSSFGEQLEGPADRGPESSLLREEGARLVAEALEYLNPEERLIVKHRFGLAGCPVMTLHEIGAKIGVSRERVRQIEVKAKTRLRRMFSNPRGFRPPRRPCVVARRSGQSVSGR